MSKKKGKGKQTQHHQVATKGGDKETLSPLQELIHSLYTTSESRLVAKDKRSKPETIKKCVNEIEKVVRTILKESKKEEWQKHVIRLNLAVQMSTGHGAALSKKIVSIFFTFLIDEVRRFWREYGITEDSVHDDYKEEEELSQDNDGKSFIMSDLSKEEYESWDRAFIFATS